MRVWAKAGSSRPPILMMARTLSLMSLSIGLAPGMSGGRPLLFVTP